MRPTRFSREDRPRQVPGWHLVAVALACFALALLVILGCSGSSPSEVPGAVTMETAYGSLSVVGQANTTLLRDSAERGMAKIHGQGYPLPLQGVTVHMVPDESAHGRYLGGGTIALSTERALSHELQHWAADELGRTGSCLTLQDHRSGYNLSCDRI